MEGLDWVDLGDVEDGRAEASPSGPVLLPAGFNLMCGALELEACASPSCREMPSDFRRERGDVGSFELDEPSPDEEPSLWGAAGFLGGSPPLRLGAALRSPSPCASLPSDVAEAMEGADVAAYSSCAAAAAADHTATPVAAAPASPVHASDSASASSFVAAGSGLASSSSVAIPPPDEAARQAVESCVAAAAAAPPQPSPGSRAHGSSGGTDHTKDVWCTTHFQYRWRCRDAGVADACDKLAASAAAAEGPGPGAAGAGRRPRAAARRGEDAASVVLGDEELEDLEIQRMQADLEDERRELQGDLRRAKQRADTVTPEMQADIERLLEAFGIPFVHAPAEAEAQCAFLAEARLVDAVVSDDSDTLVFGGTEVYRRLFSDDHMVECYTMRNLKDRLGVVQADLIVLAMLLGCDYSLGVHGVGIVNGLEIVRAFLPGNAGPHRAALDADAECWLAALRDLRAWASNVAGWGAESAGVVESDCKAVADFKVSHRNFRTQWSFPEEFPDPAVHKAFAEPLVDRSLEPFAWASVDKAKVMEQLVMSAGLPQEKVLERLDPALRRYTDTLKQPRIIDYMVPTEGAGEVGVVRSARLSSALRGLRGLNEEAEAENGEEAAVASAAGRGRGSRAPRPPRQTRTKRPRLTAPRPAEGTQAEAAPTWCLQAGSARIELDLDSD